MRDYGRSLLEVEANCFASELLMPNSHFRGASGNQEPSMALIESLAEEFQTTLTSTTIRYADVSKRRAFGESQVAGIHLSSPYLNPLEAVIKEQLSGRYSCIALGWVGTTGLFLWRYIGRQIKKAEGLY